jgi:hypothetical protein
MTEAEFAKIRQELPNMTVTQQKCLLGLLNKLKPSTGSGGFERLLPALTHVMGAYLPPSSALQRHRQWGTLNRQCDHAWEFVERLSKDGDRAMSSRLAVAVVRVARSEIERQKLPMSVWVLGSVFARIEAVFADKFPGYAPEHVAWVWGKR